jgi:hypothetical protein
MWRPQQVSREEREEAQSSRRRHSVSESLRTLNASSFPFRCNADVHEQEMENRDACFAGEFQLEMTFLASSALLCALYVKPVAVATPP